MKEYYSQIFIYIIAAFLSAGIMYLLIWLFPFVVIKYLTISILVFIVFAPFIIDGAFKLYDKIFNK